MANRERALERREVLHMSKHDSRSIALAKYPNFGKLRIRTKQPPAYGTIEPPRILREDQSIAKSLGGTLISKHVPLPGLSSPSSSSSSPPGNATSIASSSKVTKIVNDFEEAQRKQNHFRTQTGTSKYVQKHLISAKKIDKIAVGMLVAVFWWQLFW